MSKIRYYFDRLVCYIMSFLFPKRFRIPVNNNDIDPYILKLSLCSKFRYEVAAEYRWSLSTFSRKLMQAGIDLPSGIICPSDLIRIYLAFGPPNQSITEKE